MIWRESNSQLWDCGPPNHLPPGEMAIDRWFICQVLLESVYPFPNSFQGQLLTWFCVTNHSYIRLTKIGVNSSLVELIGMNLLVGYFKVNML